MQPGPENAELPLAYLLLRASRWFDAALREELAARGWPRLSAAQSLVFAFLGPDGTPPATLARLLGTTRQATHDLVGGLVCQGLLDVVDDPARRRGRLVRLTAEGRALAADAVHVLAVLEAGLPPGRAGALRESLAGFATETGAAGDADGSDLPAGLADRPVGTGGLQ
jgi:DNA-binding MarR family transcriptional regulator